MMILNKAWLAITFFCFAFGFSVTASAKPAPEWAKNAVFYEVNIRQYTEQGTFDALRAHLPRIKALGVDVLWLMPIHPIGKLHRKGTLGSYYAVRDFRELNPEFGDKKSFALFVKEAHTLGFKVILDWVANHTAPDHVWVSQHPEWYQRNSAGQLKYLMDWYDTANLDYSNPDMAAAMIAEMQYWVDGFSIDGFRCDFAAAVPVEFWQQAIAQLNQKRPLLMLAEDGSHRELFDAGFHMNYGMSLHLGLLEVAQGRMGLDQFQQLAKNIQAWYPSDTAALNFLSNHDENSWRNSALARFGNKTPAFTVLTYLLPGLPLIYSGQEAGLDKSLAFFEKDHISWRDHAMAELYQDLSLLLKTETALWEFSDDTGFLWLSVKAQTNLLAFERYSEGSRVVVMVNFSDKSLMLSGDWQGEIFGSRGQNAYREVLSGPAALTIKAEAKPKEETRKSKPAKHNHLNALTLPPWGYTVYASKPTRED